MNREVLHTNHPKRRILSNNSKLNSRSLIQDTNWSPPVKFEDERKKKVNFKELKYNLDDLFNNTPVFDAPVFDFTDNHPNKAWTMIANAIFDPFGKINEYVERMNKLKTDRKNQNNQSLSPDSKFHISK